MDSTIMEEPQKQTACSKISLVIAIIFGKKEKNADPSIILDKIKTRLRKNIIPVYKIMSLLK